MHFCCFFCLAELSESTTLHVTQGEVQGKSGSGKDTEQILPGNRQQDGMNLMDKMSILIGCEIHDFLNDRKYEMSDSASCRFFLVLVSARFRRNSILKKNS